MRLLWLVVLVFAGCDSLAQGGLCADDRWDGGASGSPSCAATQVFYSTRPCGPIGDGGFGCGAETGDLSCYDRCCSDGDCHDPARPFCRSLGFFAGTDARCTASVHVCRAADVEQCPL